MIITLTINPAVDQTVWLDRFVPGHVNRPTEAQLDPAGKGINVSRMAHRLGWPTIAFGFLAGDIGQVVQRALEDERVQNHFIRIPGQTRINVTLRERSGTATSLFVPGPHAPADALPQLDEMVDFWLQTGRVLVLAGSLLPGIPDDVYGRYIKLAQAKGVKTILDADGAALHQGVAARPYLIKPNIVEAERLLQRSLPDEASVIRAALDLHRQGIAVVVISLGSRGAVCASEEGTWKIVPPTINLQSTVGSGDSLVAGIAVALARGDALVEGLRLGTAAGAATAMSPATALGTAAEVAELVSRVEIVPISARQVA
jgi:1-phosphofructokinase